MTIVLPRGVLYGMLTLKVGQQTATDLEIIQTEGFDATRMIDPNMVIKKKMVKIPRFRMVG